MEEMNKNKKNKVPTNEEKKFFSFEKLLKYKNIAIAIFGGMATLYPIINMISNLIYQSRCEDFYKLPGKYFHLSIDNGLVYLVCILIFIALCFSPTLIAKYEDKMGNVSKVVRFLIILVSIVTGIGIGFINVLNLIEIMKQTYKAKGFFVHINNFLNEHSYLAIGIIVSLGVLASIEMVLLDKIVKIKFKAIRNSLEILFFITFLSSGLIMLYGTFFKLGIHIEDKTRYEMVNLEDKEYFVITATNGKQLIVKYTTDEEGNCYLWTDSYMFIDEYSGDSYRYVQLRNSPRIVENESE